MLKYDKTKKVVTDDEVIEGLFKCTYTHEIKDTKASMVWKGPYIPPDVWYQITSFFKWSYDKTHSESQVRLFVNPKEQTWAAWAFPQEANQGMSARELDITTNPAAQEQRKQFDDEWTLFGSVHHHCSMSAFQSGTDKANEENQDGLHITVGNMDKGIYDLHARFYRKGLLYTPDLTWFWDVGDPEKECPEAYRQYLPKDLRQKAALLAMARPVTVEFPEIWKTNLIEIPKPEIKPYVSDYPSTSGDWHIENGKWTKKKREGHTTTVYAPDWQRAKSCWGEIKAEWKKGNHTPEDLVEILDILTLEPGETFVKLLVRHRIEIEDLQKQMGLQLEQELAEENGQLPKTISAPDLDMLEEEAWRYLGQ